MTNQEALESLNEYDADSQLIEKILIDRGVTASATYSAAQRENIDLCYADLLVALANHPDIQEGSQSIAFDRRAMLRTASSIYHQYGDDKGVSINGAAIW